MITLRTTLAFGDPGVLFAGWADQQSDNLGTTGKPGTPAFASKPDEGRQADEQPPLTETEKPAIGSQERNARPRSSFCPLPWGRG